MAVVYNSQLDAFELYHQIQENDSNITTASASSAIVRAIGDGLSGSAGAAISNVVTYPLDLIITRLQIQRQVRKDVTKRSDGEYQGLQDAAQKIINKDGWLGLYTGLLSDTGKTITDSFLFFLMYDFLRRRRLRQGGLDRKTLPAVEELGVGFIAGSLTKLCTTPIANIVTRKQAAAFTAAGKNPSVQEIASDIMEEKGVSGFWSGYSASLILTLNPSLTFFLFETLKRVLLPKSKRDNPPASATFLLAAISKACASSVTYPFSLAKARLQAGGSKSQSQRNQDEDQTIDSKMPSSRFSSKTKKAARTTVFSTLLTIVEKEGFSALYEGLHLEVLKAFFSHGTTMLVKQFIQRLLTRFYYIFRILYHSYTGKSAAQHRERLANKAKQSGHEYYDLAIKRTSEKIEDVQQMTQRQMEEAKEKAKAFVEFVAEYVPGDDDAPTGGSGSGNGIAAVGEKVVESAAKWLDGKKEGE